MQQLGMPYQGSKSKIAMQLIRQMPAGVRFVDLFGGGGAMTYAAAASGKYPRLLYNEKDPAICDLFFDVQEGRFVDFKPLWISRERFEAHKDTDGYIRTVWSFGNSGRQYFCSAALEPLKRQLFAVFTADNFTQARLRWRRFIAKLDGMADMIGELTQGALRLCEEYGVVPVFHADGTLDAVKTKSAVFDAVSLRLRAYLRAALEVSEVKAVDVDRYIGTVGMAGHYYGNTQWALPTQDAYSKMQELMPGLVIPWELLHEEVQQLQNLSTLAELQDIRNFKSLNAIEPLQRIERLGKLEPLDALEITQLDYREYEHMPGDVVYCDPPYDGTAEYAEPFDTAEFLAWVKSRPYPVYVSETNDVADLSKIWEITRRGTYVANGTDCYERLYVGGLAC